MRQDDRGSPTSPKGDETNASRGRTAGIRGSGTVYELFVLSELVVQPMYGYKLRDVANRVLGPLHQLSWGTLYPLIRRLEQEGFATSETEKRQEGFLLAERGQARKIYRITEAGRERFLALMLAPGEYSRDYPDLFAIKLIKFGYLTPAQQLAVLEHYRNYVSSLRDYYHTGGSLLPSNPIVTEEERPFILQLVEYRLHTLDAELAWLDGKIAAVAIKNIQT